jgi:coproporphyrinogen III oxidase
MKEWPHDYEAHERMTGMTDERMMIRKRNDNRGIGGSIP